VDPILCQDLNPNEVLSKTTGIKDSSEVQQSLVDPQVRERLQLDITQERLNILKALLESDVNKANLAGDKYEYWHQLYKQAREQPLRNIENEERLYRYLMGSLQETKRYVNKFRITETEIKVLNPSYVSSSPKQWFE
jgi:hypothetical protein